MMFPIGSAWVTDGILLTEVAPRLLSQHKADSKPSQAKCTPSYVIQEPRAELSKFSW